MNPTRVLHIVAIMNRGGLETFIMNLYRNIDRTKIQFDFLVHKKEKGSYDEEITLLGGEIYQIPYVVDVGHFGYIEALKSFFRNHSKYQIVHCHMDEMSGIILREAKKCEIPIRIAHSHSSWPKYHLLKAIYKTYAKRLILKNATHCFACSNISARWLYGKNSKPFLIKNGIEIFNFKRNDYEVLKAKEALEITNEFIVGHVGSFTLVKNHSFIIDVFNEIIKRKPNSKLILVGDGPLREKIKNKASQLGLNSSVLLLGVRKDVPTLMHVFDVLIFPSLYEGFPLTLVEAQASGLKCFASNKISLETDLNLGLIQYIDLNKDPSYWASNVLKHNCERLENSVDKVRDQGYDIKVTALQLGKFYSALLNEMKDRSN